MAAECNHHGNPEAEESGQQSAFSRQLPLPARAEVYAIASKGILDNPFRVIDL